MRSEAVEVRVRMRARGDAWVMGDGCEGGEVRVRVRARCEE